MKRIGWASLVCLAGPAFAAAPAPQDEAQMAAQAIERTLQRHGAEVHRCFEKALADSLDVAGTVEIEVEVGEGGKVSKARSLSGDTDPAPALSPCLLASATGWQVDGIEAGASVVLPFAFASQANQFVVKSSDPTERTPGASPSKGKGKENAGPARTPPFTVKVLADSVNVRASQISLTLLSVGPASRVAMHRHPHSAKALFLLKGHARLLGPAGTPPLKIDPGSAVFVPAGYPHVIENMGRQSTAVFLQAFAPPGPEKVYRDPRDPKGRAEFEVIRDPGKAKLPPAANGKLVLMGPDDAPPMAMPGVKGTARILLDEESTGSKALAVDVVEFQPGATVPRHEHPGASEVLYVVAGNGTVTVGSESYPFETEDMIHIPADQPHSAKIGAGDKMVAIQFYAPAGPEQRFRQGAGKKK